MCRSLALLLLLGKALAHDGDVSSWTYQKGRNCYTGQGAVEIDLAPLYIGVAECRSKCEELPDCTGITVGAGDAGNCWRRKSIDISSCQVDDNFDTWTRSMPPTPAPTPALDGCLQSAKYKRDEELCREFYDEKVGIAYSMFEMATWNLNGPIGGFDMAEFYADPPDVTPEAIMNQEIREQAMTISHSGTGYGPYGGYDSSFGIIMSIGRRSNYWQHFWMCDGQGRSDPGVLAADCKDRNAPPFPGSDKITRCADWPQDYSSAHSMAYYNWTYDKFQAEKNAIVALTDTDECSNRGGWNFDYNEFEASGFSLSAMAGILSSPKNMFHDHDQQQPDDATVCKFMAAKGVKMDDNQIPVFLFAPDYNSRSSQLHVERYIDCGHDPVHSSQGVSASEVIV